MNVFTPYDTEPWTNRTTSALSLYSGGIGYANRVQGTSGLVDDLLTPLFRKATDVAGSLLDRMLDLGSIKAKEALGYRSTGEVWRDPRTQTDYVMFRTPTGTIVGVDARGNEVQAASLATNRQIVDSKGISITTVAIAGAAAVAIVAALFFTRKR